MITQRLARLAFGRSRIRWIVPGFAVAFMAPVGHAFAGDCTPPPPAPEKPDAVHLDRAIDYAACLLVRRPAALMSAELTRQPFDRPALVQTLDDGLSALDAARAIAKDMQDDAKPPTSDQRERIERLNAFGQIWRAIAAADGTPESADRLTSATVELALYTDDADPHVAEAAKLWQAHAYRKAGRPERTLQMLHPILIEGTGSAIDLFGRLERCRALADAGQFVAAVALAIKIEGKIETWMQRADPDTRKAAHLTVQSTRADLLNQWAAALRAKGFDARAREATKTANALSQSIAQSDATPLSLTSLIAGASFEPPPALTPASQPVD